ncbi:Uncharacterised protein [BD1-7 clade bacterium]|uniref:Uncharacterized protein n=1 Tax=BD1-7 clade bacterium TaxID=2029982 RepID=A0A5S9MSR4_9GAMM|nr:Uncharacterised protein [BD1-7 clade bacterium]CAA0084782.1 Uncharacterised protein [BD1-7 clade bacterium]
MFLKSEYLMSLVRITALSALLMAHASMADVPHTFTPNTPAKASEVNANFSALDATSTENADNIEALTESVNALKNTGCSTGKLIDHGYDYTWQPKDAAPGFKPLANDDSVVIYKLPFKELETGKIYHITFPSSYDPGYNADARITLYRTSTSCFGEFTISGFDASVRDVEKWRISAHRSGTALVNVENYSHPAPRDVAIKINKTLLVISGIGTIDKEQTLKHVDYDPDTDFDLTDNIDLTDVTPSTNYEQQLDNLIDYIKIVEADSE